MSSKKRMLVIPGPFVPYNDTLTLLNYNRLAYFDYEIDVIALGGVEDSGLKNELAKDTNFNKFNIKTILDYKKMDIVRKPTNIFYFLYACYKYKKETIKTFKESHYNVIYTASHPGVTHLIGKKIKKEFNVKWIASFSDPIKGSPYKGDQAIRGKNFFYKVAFKIGTFFYVGDYYEKAAIDYADKLVFICEEQRDFTCNQYKNSKELIIKSIVSDLSFNQNWEIYKDILVPKAEINNPFIAVHVGRVYGLRKIDNFLNALKELKDEGLIDSSKLIIKQYDEIDENSKKYISKYLSDIVQMNNKISYKKSLETVSKADILLLFDTLIEIGIQPYLPSKIVEYLATKKPIISTCEENSPSYKILKEYGIDTVGNDVETIKDNILKTINNYHMNNYSLLNLYSENISKKLQSEIEENDGK